MKKIVLTSILYSKKNYDLSYKLHNLCKKYSLNLVNALDFVELTIKSLELKPQIIFCDCETIELTSGNLNAFLEKNEFKDTKIVFIGDEGVQNSLKNIVCKNLMLAKIGELGEIIDNLQNNYNFENMLPSNNNNFDGLELKIYKLLSSVGISPKHSGYGYLLCGIKHVVSNNGVINSLNSALYPYIASNFRTSSANVERNIRNAIYQAWRGFGMRSWYQIFFLKTLEEGKKPTNREFIYMCSEIILMEYSKKQANC